MSISRDLIESIRKRNGIDEFDASHDKELFSRDPMQSLRDAVAWKLGDPGWADTIVDWAKQLEVVDSH